MPVRLLIGAAVVFVLVAGCAKSVPGTALPADDIVTTRTGNPSSIPLPSGSTTPSSGSDQPSASGSGGSVSISDLRGHWEGTYTCGQGESGLKLDIDSPDATGTANVTFTFFPTSGNQAAASGSYVMRLTATSGQFKFTQDHWVQQPAGYVMVDLFVPAVSDPNTLTGTVNGPSCTVFSVTRK